MGSVLYMMHFYQSYSAATFKLYLYRHSGQCYSHMEGIEECIILVARPYVLVGFITRPVITYSACKISQKIEDWTAWWIKVVIVGPKLEVGLMALSCKDPGEPSELGT